MAFSERRYAADERAYTLAQFVDEWGEEEGHLHWQYAKQEPLVYRAPPRFRLPPPKELGVPPPCIEAAEKLECKETCEVAVLKPVSVVLERPTMSSRVIGMLFADDVVRVDFFADDVDFVRIHSGSWVRKRDGDNFMKLSQPAWQFQRNAKQEPFVAKIHPPATPLKFMVREGEVNEHVCRSEASEVVKTWKRNSLIHAAEVIGDWLRLSQGSTSTFVRCGSVDDSRRLVQICPDVMHFAELAPPDIAQPKQPVAYYGICDLKYDVRSSQGRRLKVLELGNAFASKFSGCGEHIPSAYRCKYRLVRKLDREVLVDNKKLTHDAFVACGYASFRPQQCAFPREYNPNLHMTIAHRLGLNPHGQATVVLKLVNRCRGAGVVVSRTGSALDNMLRMLLVPTADPCGPFEVDQLLAVESDSIQEHCRHWWTNESPIFVVEQCETSTPLARCDAGGNEPAEYCGTMRVGFVLIRDAHREGVKFRVEFLGGYWKLPVAPVKSDDVRARCVSNAKMGTARVSEVVLKRVYQDLQRILPDVFSYEMSSAAALQDRYGHDHSLLSFFLSRQASSRMRRDYQESLKEVQNPTENRLRNNLSQRLLDKAYTFTKKVPEDEASARSRSHLERQYGVFRALQGRWREAAVHWQDSVEFHEWNASTVHLLGLHYIQSGNLAEAQNHLTRSLYMDPEWKATYVNLSHTLLLRNNHRAARKVAQEGLKRFPHSPHATYNLGCAVAKSLRRELRETLPRKDALITKARKCVKFFTEAREQQDIHSDWNDDDDARILMLGELAGKLELEEPSDLEFCDLSNYESVLLNLHGWRIHNFRP